MSITLKQLKSDDNEQIIKFNKEEVKVKKYLSVEDKIKFRDIILAQCFNDGYFDWVKYDYVFVSFVLYFYTDIKLPKTKSDNENGDRILDFYTIYDLAKTTGIYKRILSVCKCDTDELEDMVMSCVDEKKAQFVISKSTGSVLSDILGNVFNIDVKEAGKVVEQISKISDLKNFNVIKNALESNIVTGQKKDILPPDTPSEE